MRVRTHSSLPACAYRPASASPSSRILVCVYVCCSQPAVAALHRFVKLAPHNLRYETLPQHLATAGIAVNKQSLWDVPLIMSAGSSSHSTSGGGAGPGSSCGGSSRGGSSCGGSSMPGVESAAALQQRRPGASSPSSPHTHGGSGSAERRGGASPPKPVLLLPPEEFFPFVVPFR